MSVEEKMSVLDAECVVKGLRATFATGKTKAYEWRVSQLKAILKLTFDHKDDIVEALRKDLSKPLMESIVSEILLLRGSCEFALKNLKRWMLPEKVKTSMTTFPSTAEIVSEPLGVVLVISAWNYPFLLSLDPVIGAIAAGNAVVLKPSDISPTTSSLLLKLVGKYMDTSAVKVVEGAIPETTALLEQKWDKIFYTGNGKVGRIVSAAAAKHLTPVSLELGGKCPVIVDPNDIDIKVTARRIIMGKWGMNSGQACISADYVITTKDFASQLIDTLTTELKNFFGDDPMESEDMARVVNSNHFARLSKLLDDDKVADKIVYGGRRDEKKLRIAPTILLNAPEDSLVMNEEIFGPLLPVVTVDCLEESFDFICSRDKPLAAYIFTNNKKLKEKFVGSVSAGGLLVNDIGLHLANPNLPFGGVGESGIGAYHGKFSFDAFSHKKAVLYRSLGGDPPVRYPPYTPKKLRIIEALLGGSIIGIIRALLGW